MRSASRWSTLQATVLLLSVVAIPSAHPASPAQTTFHFTNQEATYARVNVLNLVENQCVGPHQSRDWTLRPDSEASG